MQEAILGEGLGYRFTRHCWVTRTFRKLPTALVTRKVVPPMPIEAKGTTAAAMRNVFMAPFTGPLFPCTQEHQSHDSHPHDSHLSRLDFLHRALLPLIVCVDACTCRMSFPWLTVRTVRLLCVEKGYRNRTNLSGGTASSWTPAPTRNSGGVALCRNVRTATMTPTAMGKALLLAITLFRASALSR